MEKCNKHCYVCFKGCFIIFKIWLFLAIFKMRKVGYFWLFLILDLAIYVLDYLAALSL